MKLHIQKFPNSPAGLNNLGVMLSENEYFIKALNILPNYNDAYENIKFGTNKITLTQIN